MAGGDWTTKRKQRTRAHVISEMSVNFLERKVLARGHQLVRMPWPEYGTDAVMLHFSDDGQSENGQVQFQVKSTDRLKLTQNGESVSVVIDSGNLHHWYWEFDHPFILVLYDAPNDRAYWLDVQEYVERERDLPDPDQKRFTLRIPVRNQLTARAIDRFRNLSLARNRRLPKKDSRR